jgi:dihydropteroate synthase
MRQADLKSLLNIKQWTGVRPLIMGVMNMTPDSFSRDGLHGKPEQILDCARRMLDAGADILDIGAESSRPGAKPIEREEERSRLLPALEKIACLRIPVSIDTRRPDIFREAMDYGAVLINDIGGLEDPGFLSILRENEKIMAVVMHKKGLPETMQSDPVYHDVVSEVRDYLEMRVRILGEAGVAPDRLILDPGIGFGKTAEHNFTLLRHIDTFAQMGPLLIGPSRKRFLDGPRHDLSPAERDVPTAAVMAWATLHNASIFRTHRPDIAVLVRHTIRSIEGAPNG